MNIGTHKINVMQKFAGACRAVTAVGLTDGRPLTPNDVLASPAGMGVIAGEYITAVLEFAGNVTATLLQQRLPGAQTLAASVVEFFGTEGRLLWRGSRAWRLPTAHLVPDGEHDRWEPLEPILPRHYDPDAGAAQDDYCFVEEYVRALDRDRDHECSGADALRVMEAMMAIFESAAYGRRVEPAPERPRTPAAALAPRARPRRPGRPGAKLRGVAEERGLAVGKDSLVSCRINIFTRRWLCCRFLLFPFLKGETYGDGTSVHTVRAE